MKKKRKQWRVVAIILFLLPFNLATASEVHQVETAGTIGFTGVYEPIGTPDPVPPITEVTKPDGQLPQTNEQSHPWLHWLGLIIVSLVFYRGRQKKNEKNKPIRK
ncbi:LPXTG cell wall anchor domain-containing protein [Enterococcus casseliflavus]|uniref:LPXTG cell wall anchor domain-containing protein n=1 Tax=Enterococcus casseliflavus TaxID=37734 RepID=UPI0039A45C66